MSKQMVLTKKDCRQAARRWLIGISTFNYETQLAPSYAFAVYPLLRKMYPNDDDFKASLLNAMKYYNTMPWISPFVMGAALGIEDEGGTESLDAVNNFKVGIMGPLAGIGDTIGWAMIPTIFGSIAASMGMQGNPLGIFLWCAFTFAFLAVRILEVEWGYNMGINVVTKLGKQITVFTEACSVLGLTVVGALIASVVNLKTGLTFTNGDVVMEVQGLLDGVMPRLLPVVAVGLMYFFMNKKKVKMTHMILIIIVLSWIGAATGIFAA
ncbi:PTS system mannose/fructose/sorbose family transporter subunit IID [Floccifex sp.]|uniref:PTS system mannose/fructose/sorbose family transporter subunit IID n=1 Tax=Floccifex sp. TaxID=2815810 RepID=UPI003F08A84A